MQRKNNLSDFIQIACKQGTDNPRMRDLTRKNLQRMNLPVYVLSKNENCLIWQLINARGDITLPHNTKFNFAILPDESGQPCLKVSILSRSKHVNITHEAPVWAAGEIHFENSQITEINDQSGSYIPKVQNEEYAKNFNFIISQFDLPVDKVKLVKDRDVNTAIETQKKSSYAQCPGFFNIRIVQVTAVTLAATAVGLSLL